MAKRWDFKSYERKLKKAKRDIPVQVGKMAVKHFKGSFDMQGFNGGGSSWRRRKSSRYNHPILNKSGELRDSIKVRTANFKNVIIRANKEYAAIHNQGLVGKAFGKYPFTMPKRQFMGSSRKLSLKVSKIINRNIKKIFR